MKKIGILYGKERSFPEAFVQRVNSKNFAGIIAEPLKIDKVIQGESTGYAVIIDRISQDIPFYRAYLKNAALCGTAVINNPFWWSADEKFFNNLIFLLEEKKTINYTLKDKVKEYLKIQRINKKNNIKSKINQLLPNIKDLLKKKNSYKKIFKLKNKENLFLYKINFLKFIYNQKILIYNLYYYFISKFLKIESKKLFPKYIKKIKLNIYRINSGVVSASIITKYIKTSLKRKYSIYETMRPILADLQYRIKIQRLKGFKIVISGRFKRDERATY